MENSISNNDEIWKKFLQSESHQEKRRGTSIWKQYEKNVIKPIIESGICKYFRNSIATTTTTKINEEFLHQICGILDVNAFEIRGPEDGGIPLRGIYLNSQLLPHSCIANTMIAVDDSFKMKIYASVNIKANEVICINYTNPLLGTKERQTHLKIGKYFLCKCRRCNDPTELGTYLSALTCTACNENDNDDGSYILYHNTDIDDDSDDNNYCWSCTKCSNKKTNNEIENILTQINIEIQEAGDDLRKLEMLIKKYEKILTAKHYMIFDIKQNIAAILRNLCMMNKFTRPGKLILKRKLQICEEILPILKILQPGISRLTAIALYEYFTPLIELAEYEYEDKEITKMQYLHKLKEAESILKQATEMLLYEPITTPEGQLARRAMMELRELRESMKVVEKENK